MSNTIYGKGEVCLTISPFDNYRMFTLYENWKDDDRKPIDLSNGQKTYLIFKSKKKEIRISEYSDYATDKVNGQVVFKISKKNAIDILSMDDNTFYITRVFEVVDATGENVISSDEEVVYAGQWQDESSSSLIQNYASEITSLNSMLEEKNNLVSNLQSSNAELIKQNVDYASQIEELKKINDELSSQVSELESKVSEYESGTVYDGTVLGNGTTVYVSDASYTEDKWSEIISNGLESTILD